MHTTFNGLLLLDYWKQLNNVACSSLFSGIVSLGQTLETENRLPFFSLCLCHVGFPKMNGNATFSWEWVITWFPLISSTKHQMHPKLMPSPGRTAEFLPTTPPSESAGINFPFSSFLYTHSIGSFLFIVSHTILCFLLCNCHTNIFGSRWRCKQKRKLFPSLQPPELW